MDLTDRDLAKMRGVHPRLTDIIVAVAGVKTNPRFRILEGVRTIERQRQLIAAGASWVNPARINPKTARHLVGADGFGHAIDLAPFLDTDGDGDQEISWHWPHYYPLAKIIKATAAEFGTPIEWGGDWSPKKRDGPHWQLPAIAPYL